MNKHIISALGKIAQVKFTKGAITRYCEVFNISTSGEAVTLETMACDKQGRRTGGGWDIPLPGDNPVITEVRWRHYDALVKDLGRVGFNADEAASAAQILAYQAEGKPVMWLVEELKKIKP